MGTKLFDRYVFGQLLQAVLFLLLLLVVVWLAPETLYKLTQQLFAGAINLKQYLIMIACDIPETMEGIIPMAVFFGCIFVFRRLSLSLELTTFFNAGISTLRLMVPVVALGLVMMLFHGLIQEYITPQTTPVYREMRIEAGMRKLENKNFTFVEKNREGEWDKFLLIGQVQNYIKTGELFDFFLFFYEPDPEGGVYISRILQANRGEWDAKENAWKLMDGKGYSLSRDGTYSESNIFGEQWVSMSRYPFELLQYRVQNPGDMGFFDLERYIDLLQEGGQSQEVAFLKVRLYQKIAFLLATLLFAILGAFLGMEKTRSKNQNSLLFGVVLLFAYQIMVTAASNLGGVGFLNAVWLAMIPLVLTVVVAWILIQIRQFSEG